MGVLFNFPGSGNRERDRRQVNGPAVSAPLPLSQLTPPVNARRALTAAATQVKLSDPASLAALRDRQTSSAAWQSEAYAAYEQIGEINYAFNLTANLISRLRIYVGAVTDRARPPTPVAEVDDLTPGLAIAAQAAADRVVRGSDSGAAGLFYDLAVNLSVTGEAYLVQIPEQPSYDGNPAIPESWSIRSVDEVSVTNDMTVALRTDRSIPAPSSSNSSAYRKQSSSGTSPTIPPTPGASTGQAMILPSDAYVGRIFRSSPRFSGEAASSLRAVLPQIEELLLLNQMFRSTILSRLNSGILFVPDGLSAAHTPTSTPLTEPTLPGSLPEPTPAAAEEDEFEEDLIDSMTLPIADPSSASSVVPLIVRGPAELGEKIKRITFERSFDEYLLARSKELMERILTGIDLPKDAVQGVADLKYANALVVAESLLRSHIEPLALLICDAFTRAYLRPALTAGGFTTEQAERIMLWFDPVDLVQRPSRSDEANSGFDRYALSFSTWRQAHGFDEGAAPTPTEIVQRMLIDKGQMTPELSETLLKVIAPLMMEDARQANAATAANPLPPEVQQALGLPPSAAGAPTPPPISTPAAPATGEPPPPPEAAFPGEPPLPPSPPPESETAPI